MAKTVSRKIPRGEATKLKPELFKPQESKLSWPLDPITQNTLTRWLNKALESGDFSETSPTFVSLGKPVTFIIGPEGNSDSNSYDYKTDGTDDNVQIQEAIDALPTNGGEIRLREGTYTLGASLAFTSAAITLSGMGAGTIVKAKDSLNAAMFDLSDPSSAFAGTIITQMTIDGNKANQTSGDAIDNLNGSFVNTGIAITHCFFQNIKDAAIVTAGGSFINNNHFETIDGNADHIFHLSGLSNNEDCVFTNNRVLISADVAVLNSGSGEYNISNNYFSFPDSYSKTAFLGSGECVIANNMIEVGSSVTSTCKILTGNALMRGNTISFGASADVLSVAIDNGGSVVTGNKISNAGRGIQVGKRSSVIGNSITGNLGHGIVVGNLADNSVISGNNILSSSSMTDDTFDGINIEAGASFLSVTGNTIDGASSSVEYKHGISENGSANNNLISGNVMRNIATQGVLVLGARTIAPDNTVDGISFSSTPTLLSTTAVAFNADADTTLYTVPLGARCVLLYAVAVAGADAGATTTISIGANGTETDFIPANTLSNLDAANDAVILKPIPNTTPLKTKSYPGGTVIQAQIASQSGGATNTVSLFGYLIV